MSRRYGPVVAGYDGGADAERVAGAAAWEAGRHGVPVRLVCALDDLAAPDGEKGAERMLAEAEQRLAGRYPDLAVQRALVPGGEAGALVAESDEAGLVVVGTRPEPGFLGRLAGSTAVQVAGHAHAPVLVMRPPQRPDDDGAPPAGGPVVVAVDPSPSAEAVVEFAVDEAVARDVGLHAVFVWSVLSVHDTGPIIADRIVASEEEEKAYRLLVEATEGWSDRYPDLRIHRHPVHYLNPVDALVQVSDRAGLLVTGSRGRGGFLGLRLGSTCDGLVRHATVPVAVVPAGAG